MLAGVRLTQVSEPQEGTLIPPTAPLPPAARMRTKVRALSNLFRVPIFTILSLRWLYAIGSGVWRQAGGARRVEGGRRGGPRMVKLLTALLDDRSSSQALLDLEECVLPELFC